MLEEADVPRRSLSIESKAVAMLGINAWLLYFLRVSLNLILTKAKIIVKILLKRAKNSLLISSTFVDH